MKVINISLNYPFVVFVLFPFVCSIPVWDSKASDITTIATLDLPDDGFSTGRKVLFKGKTIASGWLNVTFYSEADDIVFLFCVRYGDGVVVLNTKPAGRDWQTEVRTTIGHDIGNYTISIAKNADGFTSYFNKLQVDYFPDRMKAAAKKVKFQVSEGAEVEGVTSDLFGFPSLTSTSSTSSTTPTTSTTMGASILTVPVNILYPEDNGINQNALGPEEVGNKNWWVWYAVIGGGVLVVVLILMYIVMTKNHSRNDIGYETKGF